jgi:hypothetical protein
MQTDLAAEFYVPTVAIRNIGNNPETAAQINYN